MTAQFPTPVTGPPTPIVSVDLGELTLLLKLEYLQEHGSSVKVRTAGRLIDEAEAAGELTPATPYVVEVTAGNTAMALQMELRRRGHGARVVAVMSAKMSQAKVDLLERRGILVRRVPSDVRLVEDPFDAPLFQFAEQVLAELPGSVLAGQFFRASNVASHEFGTGLEITRQLATAPDAFVAGAGTGGTVTGISRALRTAGWPTEIVLADPEGSVIAPVLRGEAVEARPTTVEGIGGDFVPPLLDRAAVDAAVTVPHRDMVAAWTELLRRGLVVGSSTACSTAAALAWARGRGPSDRPPTCLVLAADSGAQYDVVRNALAAVTIDAPGPARPAAVGAAAATGPVPAAAADRPKELSA